MTENKLAAAIVVHCGKVLLVRRSKKESFLPKVWAVPGGKVDAGETPGEAVLRELREETGLDGDIARFVGHLAFKSSRDGRIVNNIQHNYLVTLRNAGSILPRVILPESDQDFRWVSTEDLENWVPGGHQHEPIGLDDHNLAAIRQAVPRPSHPQKAAATASSRRL